MHAILSGLFYATCVNLHHYVVLTLLGGAEHTRVNWDSVSVTCLGIFAWLAHERDSLQLDECVTHYRKKQCDRHTKCPEVL